MDTETSFAVNKPQHLIGDFITRHADGTPAFFSYNAVDDALMAVTQPSSDAILS